jgi:hypothetical protein
MGPLASNRCFRVVEDLDEGAVKGRIRWVFEFAWII